MLICSAVRHSHTSTVSQFHTFSEPLVNNDTGSSSKQTVDGQCTGEERETHQKEEPWLDRRTAEEREAMDACHKYTALAGPEDLPCQVPVGNDFVQVWVLIMQRGGHAMER